MLAFEWKLGAFGNPGQAKDVEKALIRAVSKAGGDAARTLRTAGTADVRSRKKLKLKTVRDQLVLDFPTNKSDMAALQWRMRVGNAPTRVIDLGARQTKAGVTFSVNAGKRSFIRGAFIQTMSSGHTGVFFRRGKARLPIDEAFSTRVSDVFKDHEFIPGVFTKGMTKFKSSFDRLLPLEFAKIKRP